MELVKPLLEAESVRDVWIGGAERRGRESRFLQHGSQSGLAGRKPNQVPPQRQGSPRSQDRRHRGVGWSSGCDRILEDKALARQAIEKGRHRTSVSEKSNVGGTQAIDRNQHQGFHSVSSPPDAPVGDATGSATPSP